MKNIMAKTIVGVHARAHTDSLINNKINKKDSSRSYNI